MLSRVLGLLTEPKAVFESIPTETRPLKHLYTHYILIVAAIPAVIGFLGAAFIGWRIDSAGELTKVSYSSALLLSLATYIAIAVGIYILGRLIHWMSATYGAVQAADVAHCTELAAYVITPLLLAGFVGFFPSLWLYMLAVLGGIAYSVYLLYIAVPIVFSLTQEQGFVFSSAILTIGLVMLMGITAATVLFWGFGMQPVFVSG